jgi:trehalose 6-phosphate phosphatase
MRALSFGADLDRFFARFAAASARVLFADYDGTLAPFQVRPELARPYPGVAEALDGIMAQGRTRVVLVSGRPAEDLARLLPLKRRPEIWGAHGWQRLTPDGELLEAEPAAPARSALDVAERAARGMGEAGARVERKPASVAVHWRGLPVLAAARVRDSLATAWRRFTDEGTLQPLPFDGGLELRARGIDKRHPVQIVLSETRGGAVAAYLGDDVTDEDAFAAMRTRGLSVLVRPAMRSTGADLWLRPPRELVAFLKSWHRHCGSRQ